MKKFQQVRRKFVLQYKYWRGQRVVRAGPSREEFNLIFDGETARLDVYSMAQNPIETNLTSGTFLTLPKSQNWMEKGSKDSELIKPGQPGNPTKNTPAWIRILDGGQVVFLEDKENFKKIQFMGKKLRGLWILEAETPNAKKETLWQLKRSELPKVKEADNMSLLNLTRTEIESLSPLKLGQIIKQRFYGTLDVDDLDGDLDDEDDRLDFQEGNPIFKCPKCGKTFIGKKGEQPKTCPNCDAKLPVGLKPVSGKGDKYPYPKGEEKKQEDDETISLARFGDTLSITEFPIFKVGTYNGKKWTRDDLTNMETNFRILRDIIIPPLKLGHGAQKFLKKEGMPSAGWMTGLKQKDDVLYASFGKVPKRIGELIKNGAYKRPSAEIYPDFRDSDGRRYGPTIAAVSLLGAESPAVKDIPPLESLTSIERLYNEALDSNSDQIEVYEVVLGDDEIVIDRNDGNGGKDDMKNNPAIMKELKEIKDSLKSRDDVIQTLQDQLKEERHLRRQESEKTFLNELTKDGKFPPALEEKTLLMFDALHDGLETVKFEEKDESGETSEVEMTLLQLFRTLLTELPQIINYSEIAKKGKMIHKGGENREIVDDEFEDIDEEDKTKNVEITGDNFQIALDKYVEKNKVDVNDPEAYQAAMFAVSKTEDLNK